MMRRIPSPFDMFSIGALIAVIAMVALMCCGCAYKGGKVIDGTNLAIGVTIPGTEWQINVLDYVGGLRVAGNDQTSITVSNEVNETNSYFGVVETKRHSRMTATIEPCETATTMAASASSCPNGNCSEGGSCPNGNCTVK